MLPIGWVVWRAGRAVGVAVSILGAATWYGVDTVSRIASHPAIPVWNAGVRLGLFLVVAVLLARLREDHIRLRTLADSDTLTGVYNSRAFRERLASEVEVARREAHPLTLAVLDLDHFKEVNDRWGHAAGDRALVILGEILRSGVRETDLVGRIGGDEFAVGLPRALALDVHPLLERFRATVKSRMEADGYPVTLSLGAVTFGAPCPDVEEMLRQVDEVLYEVKRSGRDGVVHRIGAGGPIAR